MSDDTAKGIRSPDQLREWLELDEGDHPPDLHPDLLPHVYQGQAGMMIGHPLVHTFYSPIQHAVYNRMYEAKLKEIAKYEEEGNHLAIIHIMVERPYRFQWMMKYADQMSDEDFWELVGSVWTDTENLWQHRDDWTRLLRSDRPGREYMMDELEREALATLPTTLKIYRGTASPDRRGAGLSWTLSKEKAKWFAYRFVFEGQAPWLITARVQRDDVVAYFAAREEQEIVALPEHVKILTAQRLSMKGRDEYLHGSDKLPGEQK